MVFYGKIRRVAAGYGKIRQTTASYRPPVRPLVPGSTVVRSIDVGPGIQANRALTRLFMADVPMIQISEPQRVAMDRKAKPKISLAEIELRREGIRQAEANNRIEGISNDPKAAPIIDAYINGTYDTAEAIEELDKLYKR